MPNLLNLILLVHFVLALIFAAFAMFFPELLAQAGTFDSSLVLAEPGQAYGMLFGIALVAIAALLFGARVSGSSSVRRLTLQVAFFHLGTGAALSLLLPVPLLTCIIALLIFVLLFIAYGYVWLYRPSEI